MQVFFLSITFFFFFSFFFFFLSLLEFHSCTEWVSGKQRHFFFWNLSRKAALVEILWIFRLINVGNSVVLTIYIIINRSLREVSAECSGSVLQVRVFSWPVIERQSFEPMSQAEGIFKINFCVADLRSYFSAMIYF